MAILNKGLMKAMKKTYENDNYRNISVYIIRIIGNKKNLEKGERGVFLFVSLLNIFNGLMIGTIFAKF